MIIGIKSGRWELIHRAHIETLKECAEQCDKLIVLVHNCSTKKSYMSAINRAFILQQLSFIHQTFIYSEDTEDDTVRRIAKHYYSKDYIIMFHSEELAESKYVPGASHVDKIKFIKRKKGSTGELVERIKNDGTKN